MAGPSLAARLHDIRARIRMAEAIAGREPGNVKLVAVSKTKTLELIDEAARAGQLDFGENYVREAATKVAARPDYTWHFIGSLQRNKVREVVGRFELIHSVDRLELAAAIAAAAVSVGTRQDVLLQIQIGGEASKHGFTSGEAAVAAASEASLLKGVRLRGLMCLPPLTSDEPVGRGFFRELRELSERIRREALSPEQAASFDVLSMGTSGDFEWAILEGATHVRVGMSIFGEREAR